MKTYFTILFIGLFKISLAIDLLDQVAADFKNADVNALHHLFSTTVEISLLGNDEIYSSNQAKFILMDFFEKHKPISSKIIHKVTSNPNFKFGVVVLNTNKGSFRISYNLKTKAGTQTISQIRIEENKD